MDESTPAPAPDALAIRAPGLAAAIAALIAHYRANLGTSITASQLGQIATSAVASLLRAVKESGANLTEAEVETTVLDAAGQLFDALAPLIQVPLVPAIVTTQVIDPALRRLFLDLVRGAIVSLGNIFDRVGWAEPPAAKHLAAVPHGLSFTPY